MPRHLVMLAIGLLFGGLAGYLLGVSGLAPLTGHAHGAGGAAHHAGDGHADHDHGALRRLAEGPGAPRLDLEIEADPVGGWNLHVVVENFRLAPPRAGEAQADDAGHAHLYAGEAKLARIYGPWFHLAEVPEGTRALTVTLNGADHRPLAVGDAPLSVTRPLPR